MEFTRFVVADVSEAEEIGKTEVWAEHCRKWRWEDMQGIDALMLTALYCVLNDEPFYFWKATEFNFQLLYKRSDEGPWIAKIPDEVTSKVSELADEFLPDVARSWINTEVLVAMGAWTPERMTGVQEMLQRLVTLCEEAVEAKKPILMWTCL